SSCVSADIKLNVSFRHQKSLGIGVHADELDAPEARLDHPIDGVHPAAPNTHHLDDGEVVLGRLHGALLPPGALTRAFSTWGKCRSRPCRRLRPCFPAGPFAGPSPQLQGECYVNLTHKEGTLQHVDGSVNPRVVKMHWAMQPENCAVQSRRDAEPERWEPARPRTRAGLRSALPRPGPLAVSPTWRWPPWRLRTTPALHLSRPAPAVRGPGGP